LSHRIPQVEGSGTPERERPRRGPRLDYDFAPQEIRDALSVTAGDVWACDQVTFCKNVFIPLTTACRYTCTYCVFFDAPGKARLLSEQEVREILERGQDTGCREALFTLGDKPDGRYHEIHAALRRRGYGDILDYLDAACGWALEYGLLPHSNPGDLTLDEMARLKEVNASMGVMLETTADVPVHAGMRRKTPAQRLRTLENAGQLEVPFTTGILVGIGESWEDRVHSLLCLRRLQRKYGHLQEVIVQPAVPNERWTVPSPSLSVMRRTVAMARSILPASVKIQVPPNLISVGPLMDCGVGDLGGVSPVTIDHVNPDHAWPGLDRLEQLARRHGFELIERGPVYPRFLEGGGWTTHRIRALAERQAADAGGSSRHSPSSQGR